MFILTRYKGAHAGYVPCSRPRPWAAALLLLKHANAINGDLWSYRLQAVSPELPRFPRLPHEPMRYVISEPAPLSYVITEPA